MSWRGSSRYAALFVLLLAIEVLIAVYVHDRFVRPFVGDLLVVVLLYSATRAWLAIPPRAAACAALLFACTVEVGQYFQLATLLHVDDNPALRTILGTHFDLRDFVAYACGAALVLATEHLLARRAPPPRR